MTENESIGLRQGNNSGRERVLHKVFNLGFYHWFLPSEFIREIEVLNILTIPIDGSAVRFLLIEK
jgi:hypothetical protein